jgi:hypothetical protein
MSNSLSRKDISVDGNITLTKVEDLSNIDVNVYINIAIDPLQIYENISDDLDGLGNDIDNTIIVKDIVIVGNCVDVGVGDDVIDNRFNLCIKLISCKFSTCVLICDTCLCCMCFGLIILMVILIKAQQ